PDFTFQVVGFSAFFAPPVDQSTVLSYNVAKPVLDFTGGSEGVPLYIDAPGNFQFNYNLNNAHPGDNLSILLVHNNNASPNKRSSVVQLNSPLLVPQGAAPNSGATFIPPTATPGH